MTLRGSLRFMLLPLFLGLASLGAQAPATTTAPAPADAGSPATNAVAPRSVWEGVYSKEQLARGKKAYDTQCARCHGENLLGGEDSPALVEKEFLKNWSGKSVGRLIELTRKTMPSDGPGKLSRQLCIDVTAFVLSANGFPVGKSDLGSDPELLNQILIEPKK